jgi:hypothetical protein
MSVLGLAAVAGCTPLQIDAIEKMYKVDLPPKVEKELLAQPNVRVTTPYGWLNTNGTLTPYVAPAGSQCPQHFGAAMQAGWSVADWSRLDPIIFRESRCQTGAHNPHGLDNSYGLLQLNMKAHARWVGPIVGGDFSRLWNAVTNLTVGRILFQKAHDAYGCGWQPWAMRC